MLYEIDRDPFEPADALLRAGYLTASMGRALDPDAPHEFKRGWYNYRAEDGTACCTDAAADVARVTGMMRAHGMLPDRRQAAVEPPRWSLAHVLGWSLVAFVGGLAAPGIVAGLARTFGGGA